jgi:hypothetical protein
MRPFNPESAQRIAKALGKKEAPKDDTGADPRAKELGHNAVAEWTGHERAQELIEGKKATPMDRKASEGTPDELRILPAANDSFDPEVVPLRETGNIFKHGG